ncbi:MAG TPA: LacI family DNA-binding transcriptional regulator [Stellaceae bacterium]|nr:LacI family DNA-binding transcriptional regulator [Stellaceae bacterium]
MPPERRRAVAARERARAPEAEDAALSLAARQRVGPPTIDDVAQRAGVSVATVSRIINKKAFNKASADTIDRVERAVAELNYRPMRAGRALRTLESHLVAFLIPDITNAFYSAIAHSVEIAIRDLGYAMILCNTEESPELQDAYLDEMQSHLVRAVLLLGAVDSPGLRRAAATGVPIVYLNRKAPPGLSGPFIGIDNAAAGRAVAEHFIRQGYRRCSAIHGPLGSSASRERFEGYRSRLEAAGLALEADDVQAGTLTIESGYGAAVALLSGRTRPRAIFCGNDLMAYGAFRRCRELGLKVPGDIALFGFDDNPLNEWLATWLSTIHVPHDRFGPAASRVLRALGGADSADAASAHILLPFRPVFRESA